MLLLPRIGEKLWEAHWRHIGLRRLRLIERSRLPLVFFHIPRTGGITFHEILERIEVPGGISAHFTSDAPVLAAAAEPDLFHRHGIYSGHFSSRVLPLLPAGAAKLTFLRHPAALLRSTYHLLRNLTLYGHDANLDPEGRFVAQFCMANPFEAFVESPDPRLQAHARNPQTRILGFDNSGA